MGFPGTPVCPEKVLWIEEIFELDTYLLIQVAVP